MVVMSIFVNTLSEKSRFLSPDYLAKGFVKRLSGPNIDIFEKLCTIL
jgi:hypothetical protein